MLLMQTPKATCLKFELLRKLLNNVAYCSSGHGRGIHVGLLTSSGLGVALKIHGTIDELPNPQLTRAGAVVLPEWKRQGQVRSWHNLAHLLDGAFGGTQPKKLATFLDPKETSRRKWLWRGGIALRCWTPNHYLAKPNEAGRAIPFRTDVSKPSASHS
jgi:hypothetical protein